MLRRFSSKGVVAAAAVAGPRPLRRGCSSTAAEDPMDFQRVRLGRSPIAFASASSADMRPRVAAAEAFDLATAALPSPPNFCMVHISMDHENMLEAPEVVWHQLNKCNRGGGAGAAKPTMVGGTVRQQRLGVNGYVEVMLGTIPDLVSTPFTFDEVPAELPAGAPPPFLGVAMLDWRLAIRHMGDVNARLDAVSRLLAPYNAPLVGGVYPPAEAADAEDAAPGHRPGADAAESLFFFNDSVLRGSAGAVLLHSNHVTADLVVAPPQIPVLACDVTKAAVSGSTWVICEVDGRRAVDVVREVYETTLSKHRRSKLFVGLHGGAVPLAFAGDPQSGELHVTLPPGLVAALAAAPARPVTLTCDEEQQDRETIGRSLLQYTKAKRPTWATVVEDVKVHREVRRTVTAASACVLHWTNPNLYEVFRRDDMLSLSLGTGGGTTDQHAPSIAHRVFAGGLPAAGAYVAGQVMPSVGSTDGVPEELCTAAARSTVTTRAAAHVFLRPVADVEEELAATYVAPSPAAAPAADEAAAAAAAAADGPLSKRVAVKMEEEEEAKERAAKKAKESAKEAE